MFSLTKVNKYTFLLLFASVFIAILYKALTIPITHDECATTVHYINFSYWEIMMYPDSWPNNHILNTLSVKFLTSFLPKEQWVVRIPNLFSFWIYALGIYLFLKQVFGLKNKLFLIGAIPFLLNFYLLDFFSLCRGYGMSTALVTLSMSFLLKAFVRKNSAQLWIGCVLAILASYANFTSLVYLMTCCLLFIIHYAFQNSFKIKIFTWYHFLFALIIALYGVLIANPIIKMRGDDQFKYWTNNGFIKETIVTTIDHFKYGSAYLNDGYNSYTLSIMLISLVIIIELFWINRIIKHKELTKALSNPIFISNSVLTLTVLINILNCYLTSTPNLNGRTALFFYPLFCFVFCSLFSYLSKINMLIQLAFAILLVWFTKWHITDAYKSTSVREWWFDENTFQVMKVLREDAQCKLVDLRTNWLFHPSFNFYYYTGKFQNFHLHDYNKEVDKDSGAEYYYVLSEDIPKLESNYSIIANFNNERFILKRRP